MPVVAMTREMGSLGKDVAAALAERMRRRVVYHEIIEPLASKMRLRKSHVERFLEGKSGVWERLSTDRTSLSIFTADETMRLLRDGGTGVIRGWGAAHLLKGIPHVVRVRVCAPLEVRIQRMMERLSTDNRETVASEIEINEEAHTAITRRHFNLNWRDPEEYDLVLSTDRLSVDECVDAVENLMARPKFQETEASLRKMEDLAIVWAVRSALRRDERTRKVAVTVDSEDGIVSLRGVVDDPEEGVSAAGVAAAVEGVKDVRNELRAARSPSRTIVREG